MFTAKQYRDKAAEYQGRTATAITRDERREYQDLEQRFTTLADNEQWLSDNHDKTVHAPEQVPYLSPPAGQLKVLPTVGWLSHGQNQQIGSSCGDRPA